jgi:alkanesulfonate monooxygenase SsuD/methylene tetrahydromethanopterin reductase-like flavin-dependent oxidoreductase (luciferase family)
MSDQDLQFGVMSGFPDPESARVTVEEAERLASIPSGWAITWPFRCRFSTPSPSSPSPPPSRAVSPLGTCVYLLPLRHPTLVAKQTATLDRMLSGRFALGVGVGGEFPNEYAACGVPLHQRGARLTEGIDVLKALWSAEPVTRSGRFYPLDDVRMLPPPTSSGGPPVWCGGRAPAALERAGRLGDGYVSYAVDPQRFSASLTTIRRAAAAAGRSLDAFTPAHMLFLRLDERFEDSHRTATEHLSRRYAMDFSKAARRYGALGPAADVAETIHRYREAGVRHLILDLVGPAADRHEQLIDSATR